ncbi:HD phosphohydrolase domain-containing protein [Glomus cerebriforme]|uniref:HD phosphohydrolase domain-containing protein n=1 Tax=Glomus cerebriforme TaxID=658196 RepID=A0A397TKL8_9GLOM|nr:HD phosphohydrolase domain-containing protein [Glomus cerebriforme]
MLPKRINDPIHGLMEFDDWTIQFIDTPHFQRLRNIKQLGTTYYVFPGASHNRFEHCLGVAHLAHSLVKRFQDTQPNLKVEKDLECVTLAALCHDLGHGPFSHAFDNEVIPRTRPDIKWKHEKGSEMMFDNLLETNDIDVDLGTDDVKFIKALIAGDWSVCPHRSRYLFDVVANKRNSIDVDKFDYLERDCYYLGMKSMFDFSRLMRFSRVVDDQITYYFKECYNIYELFQTRYSLHKKVYNHRVGKAIEYMLCDALVEADPVLKISKTVENPEEYLQLNDTILNQIEFSKEPSLAKSREIIKRIRTRKLYKFVDEFLVPRELKYHLNEQKINAREIIAHQAENDRLREDDVIVERLKLNYAMNDENPVDHVKFYNQYKQDEVFNLSRSQVSYLVPEQYEEINIRIFARDPEKMKSIQECFRKLLRTYISNPPQSTLPSGELTPSRGYTLPEDFETPPRKRRHSSQSPILQDDRRILKHRVNTPNT